MSMHIAARRVSVVIFRGDSGRWRDPTAALVSTATPGYRARMIFEIQQRDRSSRDGAGRRSGWFGALALCVVAGCGEQAEPTTGASESSTAATAEPVTTSTTGDTTTVMPTSTDGESSTGGTSTADDT